MTKVEQLTNRDISDFYQLYLYCFKGADSAERQAYFNYRYEHSLKYGIKEKGQLQSALLSIPLEVNFHEVRYKMNGICDVASYPEFSGHGGVTEIMKQTLQTMYEDKVALSYLAPFSYAFYRKFGYEEVFDHCHYKVDSRDLPKIKLEPKSGHVARYDFAAAISQIKSLYACDDSNHKGGVARSDWWWNYLTKKRSDWKVALYFDANDEVKAYLIYSISGDSFYAQDICYTEVAGYQHLLRFICQHQSMCRSFDYCSSDPTAYLDSSNEPGTVQATIRPYMMARLVNLGDFVSRYPFARDLETVRLSVEDPILSQNTGLWALSVKSGKVTFEKLSDESSSDGDIKLSIQSFSQAFLGYRSLDYLLKKGKISGKPQVIATLDKSLVKEKPRLKDYF